MPKTQRMTGKLFTAILLKLANIPGISYSHT